MKEQEVCEFEIQELLPIGMTFVVLGIAVAYGLNVQADIRDDLGKSACAGRTDTYTNYNTSSQYCYNSTGSTIVPGTEDFNASVDSMTATAKIPKKMPLLATVVIAAVVIGVLVRYLYVQFVTK